MEELGSRSERRREEIMTDEEEGCSYPWKLLWPDG